MKPITRRELLLSGAGLGLLSASKPSPVVATAPKKRTDIVDAHVHVWTPNTEKYPLAPGFSKKDFWFPSFTPEDLAHHSRPQGVSRINLIQMTWYGLDHSYILDIIAAQPENFVGTGIVPAVTDVSLARPDKTMLDLARGGIRAFRIRGKSTRPPLVPTTPMPSSSARPARSHSRPPEPQIRHPLPPSRWIS